MRDCIFCDIAAGEADAVKLYEDSEIVAMLEIFPIREGHSLIITKEHYETFEVLPEDLASNIMLLGQQIAKRLKEVYDVERAAFLYTGGDIAHVHAHVIPMVEKTDITSARFITNPETPVFGSRHLMADQETLLQVREKLGPFT